MIPEAVPFFVAWLLVAAIIMAVWSYREEPDELVDYFPIVFFSLAWPLFVVPYLARHARALRERLRPVPEYTITWGHHPFFPRPAFMEQATREVLERTAERIREMIREGRLG